jgi:hypothetical protein
MCQHVGPAQVANGPGTEALNFSTGPTGEMRLFDSAEAGDELRNESDVLRLRPGTHRMRTAYFESPGIMMVVREISRFDFPYGVIKRREQTP